MEQLHQSFVTLLFLSYRVTCTVQKLGVHSLLHCLVNIVNDFDEDSRIENCNFFN